MDELVKNNRQWKEIIRPEINPWKLNLREIYQYKDLLLIWMRRDILSIYSQTILGPLWFILQPALATVAYVIVFSRLAKIQLEGFSPILFYLSGIILWNYFSDCITKTASFFKDSNAIFSKVYFPKLIIPISNVLTNLVKFGIQFILFIAVFSYFYFKENNLNPNSFLLLFPLLVLLIAVLGLGSGLIVAALTIRYKDLSHLINFGIQLLMFISPVFFPVSNMNAGLYRRIILANPMSGIIEAFRYGFTGKGYFSWNVLSYDIVCIVLLFLGGILLFNLTEKKFVDII